MRAFVAIDVGDPFANASLPESAEAPSHLTLRFLGEIDDDRVEPVRAVLRTLAVSVPPFDFVLDGIGAFPSRHDPRVVWIGVTTGAEQLIRLARAVSAGLVAQGFPPERHDVVPHVTWFRVRSAPARRRARALLDGTDPRPPPRLVHARDIALKESALTSDGPRHRTVERFPLTGAPARSG